MIDWKIPYLCFSFLGLFEIGLLLSNVFSKRWSWLLFYFCVIYFPFIVLPAHLWLRFFQIFGIVTANHDLKQFILLRWASVLSFTLVDHRSWVSLKRFLVVIHGKTPVVPGQACRDYRIYLNHNVGWFYLFRFMKCTFCTASPPFSATFGRTDTEVCFYINDRCIHNFKLTDSTVKFAEQSWFLLWLAPNLS